jgi:hypothetical protein
VWVTLCQNRLICRWGNINVIDGDAWGGILRVPVAVYSAQNGSSKKYDFCNNT